MTAAYLGVAAIGRGMAAARGVETKHAIKQVDRFLSNEGYPMEEFFRGWVPFLLGGDKSIVVALDWTDFDRDDATTCALHFVTQNRRTAPLVWKTVRKSTLEGVRNAVEDDVLRTLKNCLPEGIKVLVLADRGFGDTALYAYLKDELHFDFIIRFRSNIYVEVNGIRKPAKEWVPRNGRKLKLENPLVTAEGFQVPAVVVYKAKGMKDDWCLAVSDASLTANQAIKLYAARFSIEETFRDIKDRRFGWGLQQTRIASFARRDKMLLLSAMAIVLVTLLGFAGESLGFDRGLRANTVKTRTHSLFFQGTFYFEALPNMKPEKKAALLEKFGKLLALMPFFNRAFSLA